MDPTDRYWVVQCPNCGRLLIYENLRMGKKKVKKCPYCRKSFTIIQKRKPSWTIVKYTTNDHNDARTFILNYYHQRKINF